MDCMGDVRVLCNLTDNERWMETMLHEFGHAAYSVGHDSNPELPFLLREAAGIFTTEGVAMMFGRLSRNPEWMRLNLGITPEEAASIAPDCRRAARLSQLVQARFMQVVYRFEKAMYADPEQDLNALWRDLVEKYQLLCPLSLLLPQLPDGRALCLADAPLHRREHHPQRRPGHRLLHRLL